MVIRRMSIRTPNHSDYGFIDTLIHAAFSTSQHGHNGEAALVRNLRANGDAKIELVATKDNTITGHIMLSKMHAPIRALGLAPVSVMPAYQGQGIGCALIRQALEQAKFANWQAIFLLGAPAYYNRFGFSTELAAPFTSPYSGPYFMAIELDEGCLFGKTGTVHYAPAFSA